MVRILFACSSHMWRACFHVTAACWTENLPARPSQFIGGQSVGSRRPRMECSGHRTEECQPCGQRAGSQLTVCLWSRVRSGRVPVCRSALQYCSTAAVECPAQPWQPGASILQSQHSYIRFRVRCGPDYTFPAAAASQSTAQPQSGREIGTDSDRAGRAGGLQWATARLLSVFSLVTSVTSNIAFPSMHF